MTYGLVFDVDGVLGDTEPVVAQATIRMFREMYNTEFKPEDFVPFIGTGAVAYTKGPADKVGLEIDVDAAVERRSENFIHMLEEGDSIEFPGANALIEAAAAAPDWKLAIATSGPTEKCKATLKASRVNMDLFDAFITGDMVIHKKPHPEIYLKAAEALGLPPAQCVAVEDAVTGVESAKASGMAVIAVTNSFSAEDLAEADLVVDSLEQVTVKTLNGLVG